MAWHAQERTSCEVPEPVSCKWKELLLGLIVSRPAATIAQLPLRPEASIISSGEHLVKCSSGAAQEAEQ